MKYFGKIAFVICLYWVTTQVNAEQAKMDSVRFLTDATHARIVFSLSDAVAKGFFLLPNPARLVIDFKNAHLAKKLAQPPSNHPFFARLRSAERKETDLRIVIDLKKPIAAQHLQISNGGKKGNSVILALAEPSAPVVAERIAQVTVPQKLAAPPVEAQDTKKVTQTVFHPDHELVIAIDAGHGGIDAGARGPGGTQEKKVVFAIAQKLARLINSQAGMRAVMVRKGDYYIKLRKRMDIAREAKADLFVSIHADAFNDATVTGASVYTLSNTGASSEAARWLASNENASDLVGGVSLDDKDDVLASVLLDLSQSATKDASRNVAAKILQSFHKIGKLHKNDVQKANFMVLKSPDIPSILIETAFISNPSEETALRSVVHQEKVASAVFHGITHYFAEYAPAGTRMAFSE